MLLTVPEIFGKAHPMLVHLPIGILTVCLLVQWLSTFSKYQALKPAIPVLLLAGAVSALLSCITGYTLSVVYEYNHLLLNWHMWAGIGVAFVSMLLYIRVVNQKLDRIYKLLSVLLFLLILLSGYLGGKLAHRPDHYLKQVIPTTTIIQP